MTAVLVTIALTILGLIVNDLWAWLPWCAKRLIHRAARFLPFEGRDRYEEEWLAELDALPAKGITSVLFALRVLAKAPQTGRVMRGSYEAPARRRAFELSMSAALIFGAAPMLLVIAAAVRLSGRGPAMWRSVRWGRNGLLFHMFQFRTFSLLPETPPRRFRRTRLGDHLLRTGMCHLPELVNVLRGEMAIVGPRPLPVDVDPSHWLGGPVPGAKPGMVSWESLALRGYGDVEEARRRDFEHQINWSLRGEIKVLVLCLRAFLSDR
jgi:lipopolysaccharide/colanic/teichoic acid biosynthesis glycosyltransferase